MAPIKSLTAVAFALLLFTGVALSQRIEGGDGSCGGDPSAWLFVAILASFWSRLRMPDVSCGHLVDGNVGSVGSIHLK